MFDIKSLFIKQHPDFHHNYPRLTNIVAAAARWLWKEKTFQQFAEEHSQHQGIELISKGFEYIDFDVNVSEEDLAKIPPQGSLIIVANHPLGYLDGMGLLKVISRVRARPDVKLVLNGALHNMLGMNELTIPVDNFHGSISKQSFKGIKQQLNNEGALVIFPAGLVSRLTLKGLQDTPWNPSFLRFARQKNTPILPVFIQGRNSITYYILAILSLPLAKKVLIIRELLMAKLIREIFSRHSKKRITMNFGQVLMPDELDAKYTNMEEKSQAIRDIVYSLKP